MQIVEKESAQVGLVNESLIPIQADHRAMARFRDAKSQKYRAVEDAIVNLISSVAAAKRGEEHKIHGKSYI